MFRINEDFQVSLHAFFFPPSANTVSYCRLYNKTSCAWKHKGPLQFFLILLQNIVEFRQSIWLISILQVNRGTEKNYKYINRNSSATDICGLSLPALLPYGVPSSWPYTQNQCQICHTQSSPLIYHIGTWQSLLYEVFSLHFLQLCFYMHKWVLLQT